MNTAQHAPWQAGFTGPASTPDWVVREGATFTDSLKGEIVCYMPATTTKTADKVSERARLIAAAPDLLAALQRVVALNARDDGAKATHTQNRAASREWQQEARATYQAVADAIARATGAA